jgi:hypothetical protein
LPWHSEYVYKVNYPSDVGTFTSLALRPFDEIPYIAYYDAQYGDLLLAHYSPGNGNCDAYGDDWYCELLDGNSGDNVGTYNSLDFWADEATDTWKIGISYHDTTNRALKFISWTCFPLMCTIKINVTISAAGTPFSNIGLYTSFKFLNDGTPYIVYQSTNSFSGNDSLRYAIYVGSGGNCGEGSAVGKWDCVTIDNGPGIGQYTSLDLTYDGTPYIAYYDQGLGNLKIAYYLGIVDPDCYNDNGWYCSAVDSAGNVGMYASITAQHFIGDKIFLFLYCPIIFQSLTRFRSVVVNDIRIFTYGYPTDVDQMESDHRPSAIPARI